MRDVSALARENFRVHATFPSRTINEAVVRESPAITWGGRVAEFKPVRSVR
jgi:hypothetical protein